MNLNTQSGHIIVLLFLTLLGLFATANALPYGSHILLMSFAELLRRLAVAAKR
jgi:hypothetical protein